METTTPLKLLLIGQYGVGKSSFFNRYFEKKFHPYVLSFSLDVKKKIVYYKGYDLILQMWDLVYSERMRGLLPDYYIKCKGILFLIDLTDKKSFDFINNERESIKRNCKEEQIEHFIYYLIGTKCDLKREISKEEAINYSNQYGYNYFECSALTGENVNEIISCLLRDIIEREILLTKEHKYLIDKPKNVKNKNNKQCFIF